MLRSLTLTRAGWRGASARLMFGVALAGPLAALAGCSVERFTGSTPAPASAPEAPPPPSPPPIDMAGRWTFSAASGGRCAMNFGAAQGAEGAIRPEGGCPGNFYTSRKWTFDTSGLTIRDHTNAPLGQLRMASPGRFEGQATGGGPVTLAR